MDKLCWLAGAISAILLNHQVENQFINEHRLRHCIGQKELSVVLFFSSFDCWICLNELEIWNRLHRKFYQQVNIIGVIRAPNIQVVKEFSRVHHLEFPIIFDSTNKITETFLGSHIEAQRLAFQHGKIITTNPMGIQPHSKAENDIELWLLEFEKSYKKTAKHK
jgi:peroxiredoxin